MLLAQSSYEGLGARLDTRIAFSEHAVVHLVRRRRLVVDTRVLAPARRACDVVTIYCALEGACEIAGRAGPPLPAAFVLREDEFERPDPRRPWLRVSGQDSSSLEVRVPSHRARQRAGLDAGATPLSAPTVRTLEAVWHEPSAARVAAALGALADEGLLDPALADAVGAEPSVPVPRLAGPLATTYAIQSTDVRHDALADAAAISVRTLQRELATLWRWARLEEGFAATVRRLRLRRAALLLGAPDATVSEVAQIVGYGTVDALGRGFRDAGLPAPSAVRRLLVSGA